MDGWVGELVSGHRDKGVDHETKYDDPPTRVGRVGRVVRLPLAPGFARSLNRHRCVDQSPSRSGPLVPESPETGGLWSIPEVRRCRPHGRTVGEGVPGRGVYG